MMFVIFGRAIYSSLEAWTIGRRQGLSRKVGKMFGTLADGVAQRTAEVAGILLEVAGEHQIVLDPFAQVGTMEQVPKVGQSSGRILGQSIEVIKQRPVIMGKIVIDRIAMLSRCIHETESKPSVSTKTFLC